MIEEAYEGLTAGRGVLTNIDNRKGYAGYEFDSFIGQKYHVRYRMLDSALGRWLRRDPIGYELDITLLGYVRGRVLYSIDSLGLQDTSVWDDIKRTAADAVRPAVDVAKDIGAVALESLAKARDHVSAVVTYVHENARLEDIKQLGRDAAASADPDSPPDGPGESALHNYARHCVGACEACREWGPAVAEALLFDNEVKEDGADLVFGTNEGGDDDRDNVANTKGLACCQFDVASCVQCCLWHWTLGGASETTYAMERDDSIYAINAKANSLDLLRWVARLAYAQGQ